MQLLLTVCLFHVLQCYSITLYGQTVSIADFVEIKAKLKSVVSKNAFAKLRSMGKGTNLKQNQYYVVSLKFIFKFCTLDCLCPDI